MKDPRSIYYLIDITKEPLLADLSELNSWASENCYQATCLNTRDIWFADVDFKDLLPKDLDIDISPYGDKATAKEVFRESRVSDDPVCLVGNPYRQSLIEFTTSFALETAMSGEYRVYQTAAGLRLIRTDKHLKPRSEESVSAHFRVNTDRRYQELCIYQNCYRARLTPKPWRLDQLPDDSRVGTVQYYGSCKVKEGYWDRQTNRNVRSEVIWKSNPFGSEEIQKAVTYHDLFTKANHKNIHYLA